jgi:hypothetical protein
MRLLGAGTIQSGDQLGMLPRWHNFQVACIDKWRLDINYIKRPAAVLPCWHNFQVACIDKWRLEIARTCPTCPTPPSFGAKHFPNQ